MREQRRACEALGRESLLGGGLWSSRDARAALHCVGGTGCPLRRGALLTRTGRSRSSPLGDPVLWPQRRGWAWGRGGNRCDFSGQRMDRAGRERGHGQEKHRPEAVGPGAAPGAWCGRGLGSPLPGQASSVDICLAVSPHFHVKGRRDMTRGLGAAICSWSTLRWDPRSHHKGGGSRMRRKPTEGAFGDEGGSEGQGHSGSLSPSGRVPPRWLWAQPLSDVPSPPRARPL